MSAVAREAGVATGTAYVHYPSKDEMVIAAYMELKRDLGREATAKVDAAAPAWQRFVELWKGLYRFFRHDPERARFLLQVEASPYAAPAHERFLADGEDPVSAMAAAPDMLENLVDLPLMVLYDLGLGAAVRAAADPERDLDDPVLETMASQCWRAITRA